MQAFSINGQLCSKTEASVSVMDHGLLYGDGVFEGLRFYSGKIFKLDQHLYRLFDSASAIALRIPMQSDELKRALKDAIVESTLTDGYVRLVVTRGEGTLGVNPATCHSPKVIIIVDQLSLVSENVRQEGAKLIIASTRRLQSDQLDSRIKSLNYLNQVMARLEANAAGADEAVMLNNQGRIAEGTADNIFIIKDRELKTPPLSEGALAGITRDTLLAIADSVDLNVIETPLSAYDLYTADECFLTGTGAELIPVREVAGRKIKAVRGPMFALLEKAFIQCTTGNTLAVC